MIKKFENFKQNTWFSELNPPFTSEDLDDIILSYIEEYNLESENYYFCKKTNFPYSISNENSVGGGIDENLRRKIINQIEQKKSDDDIITIRFKSKLSNFIYDGLDELCKKIGSILGCETPTHRTFRVATGFSYKSFADIRIKLKWNI